MTKSYLNDLAYKIIGTAIDIHKTLGPGLLESVYHKCMKYQLKQLELNVKSELIVPIKYKEMIIENSPLRCDLLINDSVAIEIKSCDKLLPIHTSQLLTYMKFLEVPFGILLNFNVVNIFQEGQKTLVSENFRLLPN